MTDKVLIDRALLQDLIDDVSDYAASREFKGRETKWRTELLEKSRALLAAGASEGQEPVAYLRKDEYGNSDTVDSHIYGAFPVYAHPSAELTALRERIAGMEKDAERYRWLKMRSSVGEQRQIMSTPWGQWDAFADAAIAKQDAKEQK